MRQKFQRSLFNKTNRLHLSQIPRVGRVVRDETEQTILGMRSYECRETKDKKTLMLL